MAISAKQAAKAAAAGYQFEHAEFEIPVWEENLPVVQILIDMRRQLNVSMGGAVGFIYASLYPLLDRVFPDPDQWMEAFRDFQVMESVAITELSAKKA